MQHNWSFKHSCMDHDKKLAFIQNMTNQALTHMERTPNEPTPKGEMSHDKKLAFVTAMAKHGLQHLSIGGAIFGQNEYNANLAPTQTSNYGNTINQATDQSLAGYGNFQKIQNQQQGLANQLQNQANGQGPNPAQAALNQATGQNVSNQAALMAGQRGASANPGLIARQAAQQGAAIQQNAVGQSATLQAQQQLAAQQQLQAQQQALQSGNLSEQGVNNQLFSGAAGAQNSQNANDISNYGMAQGINAAVSQNNTNNLSSGIGGLLNGVAAPLLGLFSEGGVAGADGIHDHLKNVAMLYHPQHFSDGGCVDSESKKEPEIMMAKEGAVVPGKAEYKGDNEKNDVVPAMLSKGEVVIDNNTLNDPGPVGKMARALKMHIESKNNGKKS